MAKREIQTTVSAPNSGLIRLEIMESNIVSLFRNVYLLTHSEAENLINQLTEFTIREYEV